MSIVRMMAAAMLVAGMAWAQESAPKTETPTTQPTSRPTSGTPWMKFPVGSVIQYEGTSSNTFETEQGNGELTITAQSRCVVLSEEKDGRLRLGWISQQTMDQGGMEMPGEATATIYIFDPKSNTLVEEPRKSMDFRGMMSGVFSRPPIPPVFGEELRANSTRDHDGVLDSVGIGMPLRLPQTVSVEIATAEDKKGQATVTIAPKGKGPYSPKAELGHSPDGSPAEIEGLNITIVAAKTSFVVDSTAGKVLSMHVESETEFNEQMTIIAATEIKEKGRATVDAEALTQIAKGLEELREASSLVTKGHEAIAAKLKGFNDRYPKSGLKDIAEAMIKQAEFMEQFMGGGEEMDGEDHEDHEHEPESAPASKPSEKKDGESNGESAELPEAEEPEEDELDLVGKPAADFTLKNLDGQDTKLSDFKGKVVLLSFWGVA